jgi:hypothetical protein
MGQTYLLGPEPFNSDIFVHGSSAATTVWFAPNYNTPIDYVASGGNPGGYAGYSSSWNNYWGNFIRLPQVNCSGRDTVILEMDMSHSYFVAQPNDWIRFYLWDQGSGSYKNNVSSVMIDGIESIVNFGANGFGFRFNTPRTWAHIEVTFYLTNVVVKSNVLFYIEPNCYYNNSNVFFVSFDNIGIMADPLTGIEEQKASAPAVFPNPAKDICTLTLPENTTSIGIYTVQGSLVKSLTPEMGSHEFSISTEALSNGLYYVVTRTEQGNRSSLPLMIQH